MSSQFDDIFDAGYGAFAWSQAEREPVLFHKFESDEAVRLADVIVYRGEEQTESRPSEATVSRDRYITLTFDFAPLGRLPLTKDYVLLHGDDGKYTFEDITERTSNRVTCRFKVPVQQRHGRR